jgi:hypothetical protein
MFGIVRPCRHRLDAPLRRSWMSHLCGLCLTLRDEHGHATRLATNYDGLLVSVLAEAQAPIGSPRRRAAPCLGRGMAGADVVDSRSEGARLAASVSLILAAGKTRDHVVDGDGPFAGRIAGAAGRRIADQWERAGARTATAIGFDADVLTLALDRQTALEQASSRLGPLGPGLLDLTEPTEDAVAAAFAYTATLAGRPHNAAGLAEVGRRFGRVVHLVDAVEDRPADQRAGAFNPLVATATTNAEALRHCEDSVVAIDHAVADLDLADDRLVRVLLGREVRHAVDRTFGVGGHAHGAAPAGPGFVAHQFAGGDGMDPVDPRRQRRQNRGGIGCCDCCECCACCECVSCCDC